MEGLSGPRVRGAWRLRRPAVAAAVVALFAVVLLSDLPSDVKRYTSGFGLAGAGLALTAGFAYRFRTATGRRRRAWGCFTVAAALVTTSNVLLMSFGSTPTRGASGDLLLLAGLILGIGGMVTFPLARRRGTDLARMVIDGVVIGGSVLFIASATAFPEILEGPHSVQSSPLVAVIDIGLATVALLLTLRAAPRDRLVLGLTAAGFAAVSISDLGFTAISARSGHFDFGTIVDIGWIAGYLLITLAVINPDSSALPRGELAAESSPVAGTVLMLLLVPGAALISLSGSDRNELTTSGALWLIILVCVLARQILLVVDNERLRRVLERRVDERGRSLREVAQRSDLLVNSVGDGIYGVDRFGRITFVNPAASQVLGHAQHELIGLNAHEAFHAPAADGTAYPFDACYIAEAVRDQDVTSAEEDRYLRADGRIVPVEVTASPLIADGASIGAVVVFRDVTQRQEVDRMKSEFVSMVSHELRTPLTAIRGSLGLIAGGALGEVSAPAARMVDIALVSCERLTRLINEILDIERVESGVLSFDVEPHSARGLIDNAVGQVQVLAAEAGVPVTVGEVEGEVLADADRVVQTLLNLLGNAIKFSSSGEPVDVGARRRGGSIEFAVRDRGRGIPEDQLDSVFDRFSQVDSSDAREKGGSGLGLAISRSIVEKLGGKIWAVNNEGSGSTFRFTLPLAHSPADDNTHDGTDDPTDGPGTDVPAGDAGVNSVRGRAPVETRR